MTEVLLDEHGHCDRCYRPLTEGEHGLGLCPLQPRRSAPVVRPDSIPGGLLIEHGLCNPDGTPKRYDSHSEITRACAERGVIRWTDVYEESETREGREYNNWLRSGEALKARNERVAARRLKGKEY